MTMITSSFGVAVLAASLMFVSAAGAADPAVKCESGKLKEASKYGACRLKADARAVTKGGSADYTKCEGKLADKWAEIESTAGPGVCPSEGDATSMDSRITIDTLEIADLLAGGAVISTGPNPPAPAAACAEPPSLLSTVIESQLDSAQTLADDRRNDLLDPSVITVVMCGTGAPIPSDRAQACTAVFANGKFLLFDAGDGSQRSMESLNLPLVDLTAVFLTHFHSDHIADLGEVISRSWILGRTSTVPVYGGKEVERVVDGFNLIYAPDEAYRTTHHGVAIFPPGTLPAQSNEIVGADEDGVVVFSQDGVTVTAYGVDHSPVEPALGYRIEYAGKSVVISGDTINTPGLQNASAGADVLVSDAMNKSFIAEAECAFGRLDNTRNEKIFKDIRSYHIDVTELGNLAEAAGVDTLVLTHQTPSLTGSPIDTFFTTPVSAVYSGTLVVAQDGDEVTINVP